MKKLFSKKYWVICISSLSIGAGVALACAGGDDWEMDNNSQFTPEAFVDSIYRPFFYTDMYYYYTGYDVDHNTRFNQSNSNDWAGYLDLKNSRSEIKYLLESTSLTAIDSAALFFNGKIKSLPVPLQTVGLLHNKRNKKIAAFITYLVLAKKCERFSVNRIKYLWEEEEKKPVFNAEKLNAELLSQFNSAKDVFLKQRYWFQLVRSYYYNAAPQMAIDLFEKHKEQFPQNTMYYRVIAYAAGAYYKTKNYSKANYYYSKVYDGCNDLKMAAHYSFHPQEEADWKTTLALCRNKDEQATLWQMIGIYYSDAKRAINEIYSLNPKSEKLDLLLVRAVNMEEQKPRNEAYQWEISPEQFNKDDNSKNLLALVTRIADAGNTAKPYMWQIAAGYCNMLAGNYSKAKSYYAIAEKTAPVNNLPRLQLRLLKAINKIGEAKLIDSKLENEILADLIWLRDFNNSAYPAFRYRNAYEWIKRTMAAGYRLQQQWVKSECFVSTPQFYGNKKNVEAMKTFLDKNNKTPYEQMYATLYNFKKADLLEYEAILLTFDNKIADAITKMEQAGGNGQLPGNPFNGKIIDCHDCDHNAPQKIKYTKLSLLKKMKEMQYNLNNGNDVYNNALLLGNAFYNISHYGNARYYYESPVIGEYLYSPFSLDTTFRSVLIDMANVEKYYTLALQAAQTDEQKAKCHYMLAKCERNNWYNETLYKNNNEEYGSRPAEDFKAWNGFKALQQYSNTQYYKEVIKECGYFTIYARGQ